MVAGLLVACGGAGLACREEACPGAERCCERAQDAIAVAPLLSPATSTATFGCPVPEGASDELCAEIAEGARRELEARALTVPDACL